MSNVLAHLTVLGRLVAAYPHTADQAWFRILAFMVIAWITEATEFALAGFMGCFLFWALGIVKFDASPGQALRHALLPPEAKGPG